MSGIRQTAGPVEPWKDISEARGSKAAKKSFFELPSFGPVGKKEFNKLKQQQGKEKDISAVVNDQLEKAVEHLSNPKTKKKGEAELEAIGKALQYQEMPTDSIKNVKNLQKYANVKEVKELVAKTLGRISEKDQASKARAAAIFEAYKPHQAALAEQPKRAVIFHGEPEEVESTPQQPGKVVFHASPDDSKDIQTAPLQTEEQAEQPKTVAPLKQKRKVSFAPEVELAEAAKKIAFKAKQAQEKIEQQEREKIKQQARKEELKGLLSQFEEISGSKVGFEEKYEKLQQLFQTIWDRRADLGPNHMEVFKKIENKHFQNFLEGKDANLRADRAAERLKASMTSSKEEVQKREQFDTASVDELISFIETVDAQYKGMLFQTIWRRQSEMEHSGIKLSEIDNEDFKAFLNEKLELESPQEKPKPKTEKENYSLQAIMDRTEKEEMARIKIDTFQDARKLIKKSLRSDTENKKLFEWFEKQSLKEIENYFGSTLKENELISLVGKIPERHNEALFKSIWTRRKQWGENYMTVFRDIGNAKFNAFLDKQKTA